MRVVNYSSLRRSNQRSGTYPDAPIRIPYAYLLPSPIPRHWCCALLLPRSATPSHAPLPSCSDRNPSRCRAGRFSAMPVAGRRAAGTAGSACAPFLSFQAAMSHVGGPGSRAAGRPRFIARVRGLSYWPRYVRFQKNSWKSAIARHYSQQLHGISHSTHSALWVYSQPPRAW